MKRILKIIILFCFASVLFVSCGTYESYVLLNDIKVPEGYVAPKRHDLIITRGDNLQIVVAHHVPKVVEVFNQKLSSNEFGSKLNSYVVNSDGYISMPVFDSVSVVGMTCRELENYLMQRMEKDGVAYGATVSVKILNFKVTVIGESGTGVYEFNDDGATVLDLVAKASLTGSQNIRRDKILVMRNADSLIQTQYINLLSTDLFYSPYFYLQQNDVFYVYPDNTAIRKSNQTTDYWLSRVSIVTSLISVATLVIAIFKK